MRALAADGFQANLHGDDRPGRRLGVKVLGNLSPDAFGGRGLLIVVNQLGRFARLACRYQRLDAPRVAVEVAGNLIRLRQQQRLELV